MVEDVHASGDASPFLHPAPRNNYHGSATTSAPGSDNSRPAHSWAAAEIGIAAPPPAELPVRRRARPR